MTPPEETGTPPLRDLGPNPALMLGIRTALLALSILLLFPDALAGIAHAAWPRFVEGLGAWRWAAWGACFVAMVMVRFAGGPKRGG